MVTTRRFGAETSVTRAALVDAAEAVMLTDGYAAVTSRRVAERAGLKAGLVHYYFATMDDLLLALYRQRSEEGLQRQTRALESDQPLWALWDYSRDPRGTALMMEFMALANHRKTIRAEFAAAAERYRSEQIKGVKSILRRYKCDLKEYPPVVVSMLIVGISRVVVIEEESLGISIGHAQTVAFVERILTKLEGRRRSHVGKRQSLNVT